ncbi:MAG: serpin family protein [Propionibacteriaceae bacterium]
MSTASISRRRVLHGLSLAVAALLVTDLSACALAEPELARADVRRAPPDPGSVPAIIRTSCAFSLDLVRQVAGLDNLVCSPLSALVALSMVRNGAAGATAVEMDQTMHLPPLAELNAGLNALTQTLQRVNGTRRRPDGSKTKVSLNLVNSVWGQTGMSWQAPFLAALAGSYGTGVHQLDFAADPDRARRHVNDWVSDQTDERIEHIIPPDLIRPDTRMVLANALHLKAGWREALTEIADGPFRTPDSAVTTPRLQGQVLGSRHTSGHWDSARIPCAGDELAMTVILPTTDISTLLAQLTAADLALLLAGPAPMTVDLTLPAFTYGTKLPLTEVLKELGMPRAFSPQAEFPGITAQETLMLDEALHQGWVAVDQNGMEAAAATVVTMVPVSAGPPADRTLVLDRPFLFCLHDTSMGTPLMMGVVNNPAEN